MWSSFGTSDFGTSSCLVLPERIEEVGDQVMERKGFGMVVRAIFIPKIVNLAVFTPHKRIHTWHPILPYLMGRGHM